MKSKITQICGYITFLLGIVGIVFYVVVFIEIFDSSYPVRDEEILINTTT